MRLRFSDNTFAFGGLEFLSTADESVVPGSGVLAMAGNGVRLAPILSPGAGAMGLASNPVNVALDIPVVPGGEDGADGGAAIAMSGNPVTLVTEPHWLDGEFAMEFPDGEFELFEPGDGEFQIEWPDGEFVLIGPQSLSQE